MELQKSSGGRTLESYVEEAKKLNVRYLDYYYEDAICTPQHTLSDITWDVNSWNGSYSDWHLYAANTLAGFLCGIASSDMRKQVVARLQGEHRVVCEFYTNPVWFNKLASQADFWEAPYIKDWIQELPDEVQCAGVAGYGMMLQYIAERLKTEEVCLAAVKQNGMALKFVREQTPKICKAAVRKSGWALPYVKEQTPEICLAAVKKRGCALEWVKEQTLKVCLAAVKHDAEALKFIKDAEMREQVKNTLGTRQEVSSMSVF